MSPSVARTGHPGIPTCRKAENIGSMQVFRLLDPDRALPSVSCCSSETCGRRPGYFILLYGPQQRFSERHSGGAVFWAAGLEVKLRAYAISRHRGGVTRLTA